MASEIKDINLAESGQRKIEWVRRNCPLLTMLKDEFAATRPFAGKKIALSIHLEAKTAYLCEVLAAGGAEMYVTGSNPLSTQDDVAAALVEEGIEVHAWHGISDQDYDRCIDAILAVGPHIIIDDGGDLVHRVHTRFPELIENIIGGCEETTTGIIRLEALNREGKLRFPMVRVNNAMMKHFFDNRYGTGQSVWDGINRTTNLVVAGKTVVVAGYGWCGKGVAMRAKGLGAKVIVTEIDPVKAIEAIMDGFDVMPMAEAAPLGDVFVTVTGCEKVIDEEDFLRMHEGAVCCNAGHFDCEVDMAGLRELAVETREMRANITGYRLPNGIWIYVLGEGRLVNLACGDGHPAEIMDMSFAIQALSAKYLVEHQGTFDEMLMDVPEEVDRDVARKELAFMGKRIDVLTPEQERYLNESGI